MLLDAKAIGGRIRNLRIAKGMSQAALGKKIKTDGALVSLWETGKRTPSLRKRVSLATFFKVSIEYISCDGDQRSAVRDMVLTRSRKKLEAGKATSADIRAATAAAPASDAERSISAREEHLKQLMEGAHERLLRKLSRLRAEVGFD
jgi:transcriptional regulator with XRE-family HTH domain